MLFMSGLVAIADCDARSLACAASNLYHKEVRLAMVLSIERLFTS